MYAGISGGLHLPCIEADGNIGDEARVEQRAADSSLHHPWYHQRSLRAAGRALHGLRVQHEASRPDAN